MSGVDPKAVPKIKLSDGKAIPQIGLGTWKSKPGEVKQAVIDAINAGYRHIDCAWIYGNEPEVGEAIAAKIQDGTVKREDLYVVSKLWNTMHSTAGVRTGITETLKNLKLSYVDLYLIHWPVSYKEGPGLDNKFPKVDNAEPFPADKGVILYDESIDYVQTWQDIEHLIDEGLVRSAGVSNFNTYQIERVLKVATHKPVMNQVEAHVYMNQQRLAKFCAERGITLTAYCVLGSRDRPWANDQEKKPLDDPVVVQIAKKHNRPPAQILLRHLMELGYVVLAKSANKQRIEENLHAVEFKLSPEDMKQLNSLDLKVHRFACNHWDIGKTKQYPFAPSAEGGVEF